VNSPFLVLGLCGSIDPGAWLLGALGTVAVLGVTYVGGGLLLAFLIVQFVALFSPKKAPEQKAPPAPRGSDWAHGERPNGAGLDLVTRAALGAWWLAQAEREHASATSTNLTSWLLTALGAPAELVLSHQTLAMQKVELARTCFAMARGYSREEHLVRQRRDLLHNASPGPVAFEAVLRAVVRESCLAAGFGADLAAASARACEEPVARAAFQKLADGGARTVEQAWAVLRWLVGQEEAAARGPLKGALTGLPALPRPSAVAPEARLLMARANGHSLERHGLLPEATLASAWESRVRVTRSMLERLLASPGAGNLRAP
jgi:hypothetical protein